MAQIYYHLLSTPILSDTGAVTQEASFTLEAAKKEFKQIKRSTFKMTGKDVPIANLIWAPLAKRMIMINFIVMVILVICGCKLITDSAIHGIAYIVSSLIVFPIFLKVKNLPASKLYAWRIIRLISAFSFVMLIEFLFRGVI
jgi:hypothetical protein